MRNLDNFSKDVIRLTVYGFYKENDFMEDEVPTVE